MTARHILTGSTAVGILVISYSLTLVWMGVIFYLSAQVGTVSNDLSTGITERIVTVIEQVAPQAEIDARGLNHFVRKNAHFAAYLLLGVLSVNSLYLSWFYARDSGKQSGFGRLPDWAGRLILRLRRWPRWRIWLTAWLFCVFYAITDELHQSFVPGRSCQLQDVLIDSAGAAAGILIYLMIWRLTARRPRKNDKARI